MLFFPRPLDFYEEEKKIGLLNENENENENEDEDEDVGGFFGGFFP